MGVNPRRGGAGERWCGRPGVTTFAEVLLAAVITETASAALQLNFLWATLIFTRQRERDATRTTFTLVPRALLIFVQVNQLVEFSVKLLLR